MTSTGKAYNHSGRTNERNRLAKIINTSKVNLSSLTAQEREWLYNGYDTTITSEVFDVLHPQLDNHTAATYRFSKKLQGPVLEMRLRGVLVDKQRRLEVLERYHEQLDHLEANLERIVREGLGMVGFNWRSNDNLRELFYGKLRIPPIRKRGTITVDRDALERMEEYLIARPILSHLKLMRDIGKKIGAL